MKIIATAAVLLLTTGIVSAQQKQGTVKYERTSQMQIRFAGMNEEMERQIPKTRTDKFELVFGNNQSLWKSDAEEGDDGVVTSDNGGMQIRMVVAGNDDVLYNHFGEARRIEKRELFDKTFIIDDSIRPLKWKMTGETKTILNHNCMKATAIRYSKRPEVNMDNGKIERREVDDTTTITAWFASDIPVSAGPAEYQGQLPGLILEMDINNGRQTFKATELVEKADLASIKAPTGKKRYTIEEFRKEQQKLMDEMQQNNQGGRRMIRMN